MMMAMQEGTAMKKNGLRSEAEEGISERLSKLENLYFPRAIQPSASTPSQRKSLFLDLLHRDLPVFLGTFGQPRILPYANIHP
ncbi:hypothetical protein RHSIM_Rhsim04G0176300 [Rhododendron simsii]|uniref:Uncharacterized protein n=1 Tax=Rhododendron simsii TaxID=118357 RepID=A0A834LRP0_RHOSS|nr:hypothetical protein RHSIM_Rhsim04G0176300 [Rhododendron simsii]